MHLLGPFLPIRLFPRFPETVFFFWLECCSPNTVLSFILCSWDVASGAKSAPRQAISPRILLQRLVSCRELCSPDSLLSSVHCFPDFCLFGSNVSDADFKICRGLGKKASLLQELGTPTIDVMRSIKKALDPYWLMNPGKIFEPTNEGTNDEGATTAASTLGLPVEGH